MNVFARDKDLFLQTHGLFFFFFWLEPNQLHSDLAIYSRGPESVELCKQSDQVHISLLWQNSLIKITLPLHVEGDRENCLTERSLNLLYKFVKDLLCWRCLLWCLNKSADFGLLSTQLQTVEIALPFLLRWFIHVYWNALKNTPKTQATMFNERVCDPALKASMDMSSSDTRGKPK